MDELTKYKLELLRARHAVKRLLITYGRMLQGEWYEATAKECGLELDSIGMLRDEDFELRHDGRAEDFLDDLPRSAHRAVLKLAAAAILPEATPEHQAFLDRSQPLDRSKPLEVSPPSFLQQARLEEHPEEHPEELSEFMDRCGRALKRTGPAPLFDVLIYERATLKVDAIAGTKLEFSGGFHNACKRQAVVSGRLNSDYAAGIFYSGRHSIGDVVDLNYNMFKPQMSEPLDPPQSPGSPVPTEMENLEEWAKHCDR